MNKGLLAVWRKKRVGRERPEVVEERESNKENKMISTIESERSDEGFTVLDHSSSSDDHWSANSNGGEVVQSYNKEEEMIPLKKRIILTYLAGDEEKEKLKSVPPKKRRLLICYNQLKAPNKNEDMTKLEAIHVNHTANASTTTATSTAVAPSYASSTNQGANHEMNHLIEAEAAAAAAAIAYEENIMVEFVRKANAEVVIPPQDHDLISPSENKENSNAISRKLPRSLMEERTEVVTPVIPKRPRTKGKRMARAIYTPNIAALFNAIDLVQEAEERIAGAKDGQGGSAGGRRDDDLYSTVKRTRRCQAVTDHDSSRCTWVNGNGWRCTKTRRDRRQLCGHHLVKEGIVKKIKKENVPPRVVAGFKPDKNSKIAGVLQEDHGKPRPGRKSSDQKAKRSIIRSKPIRSLLAETPLLLLVDDDD